MANFLPYELFFLKASLSLKLRKVSAIEASKSAVQIETIDEPRFPDQEFSKHLKLFVKEKSKFDYLLSFL